MSTRREDIAKAMFTETKQVFMDNLKAAPKQEWTEFMEVVPSTKMQETYDTVGNLKPAAIKEEGAPILYGKITTGRTTTVINETVANGFEASMESKEDDQYGLIDKTKVNELARTMIDIKEESAAAVWNNVATAVGADGVPYASHIHPLINTGAAFNDNLVHGVVNVDATGFTAWDTAVKQFNLQKNHYGKKFATAPTHALMSINRQTSIAALLESTLKAGEASNTKNTIPRLSLIFGRYLNDLPIIMLDKNIRSAILQKRKGIVTEYDYDKRVTYNFYFNIHERYKCAMVNDGFGFVLLTGAVA